MQKYRHDNLNETASHRELHLTFLDSSIDKGNDMLSRLATLRVAPPCVVTLWTRHLERGATAVEYALMVMLIALVIIGAVTALGVSLTPIFTNAANGI